MAKIRLKVKCYLIMEVDDETGVDFMINHDPNDPLNWSIQTDKDIKETYHDGESDEAMTLEETYGFSTIEVLDSNDEVIYKNGY